MADIRVGMTSSATPNRAIAAVESAPIWTARQVRAIFLASFTLVAGPLVALTLISWAHGRPTHGAVPTAVVALLSVLWSLFAFSAVITAVGILSFRNAHGRGEEDSNETRGHGSIARIPNEVCFRIVTRGDSVEVVKKTVFAVRREMQQLPLFPYVIEVVTDSDSQLPLGVGGDLVQMCVPLTYRTSKGSKYKARALQYALQTSSLPDETWIFHLDEETHITPSVILGIRTPLPKRRRVARSDLGRA